MLHYFIIAMPNNIHNENKDFALAIVFGKRHKYVCMLFAKTKLKMIILAITNFANSALLGADFLWPL